MGRGRGGGCADVHSVHILGVSSLSVSMVLRENDDRYAHSLAYYCTGYISLLLHLQGQSVNGIVQKYIYEVKGEFTISRDIWQTKYTFYLNFALTVSASLLMVSC